MEPLVRTLRCLRGLSVGDAFGELFFREPPQALIRRALPPGMWRYTDDTHMAISVVRVLRDCAEIDPDALAAGFAAEHGREPWRGYAGGAARLLTALRAGADWRAEAPALFDGGSWGNGGAMRAAPIGAFFAGHPARAAAEAARSAAVTHAHPEGVAGAVAVAVAAALIAGETADAATDETAEMDEAPRGVALLNAVLAHIDEGAVRTRDGIARARDIDPADHAGAIRRLGTGEDVAAFDTAPFCLWMVAHHGADFEDAMWHTVAGMGDRDTTCAIVAGILAADGRSLPDAWLARTEPLPEDVR